MGPDPRPAAADADARADGDPSSPRRAATRRMLAVEVTLVVGLALGLSALRSAVRLVAALTAPEPFSEQTATLNAARYPDQPWVDLAYQLVSVVALLLPALLAIHLALRDSTWSDLGLTARRWGRAVLAGTGIAAVVGGAGLALYLTSRALGLSVEVRASALTDVWWALPVLVLSAGANAVLEEVVVVGYLVRRLEQLGVSPGRALWVSAGVRSAYHLYQGAAGVVGNLVMGLLFARFFQRTRSVVPLVVAHWLIDIAAFVGYALLATRVGWL